MRTFSLIAGLSLVTLLSACGTPSDGYYDANGNYIPYNRYNQQNHDHAPIPGGTHDPYASDDAHPVAYTTTTTTYSYDRPGYYDSNGYYRTMSGGVTAPDDMLPPRGMCRVWFPDRALDDEPAIESCSGIHSRAPAGAYIIYGG